MEVAVVYHSGYGHTKNQAVAVLEGIDSVAHVTGKAIEIDEHGEISESDWEVLDQAGAIVFGSPTYMGMASWQFKKFADASSKRWFSQTWKDKLAAGFTNSASMNGDKHSTLSYLFTLSMQHGMLWIGTGLMPANAKNSSRNDINYLGAFSGLMAQSPADAGADEAPTTGDLQTARIYGQRIAEMAQKIS